MPSQRDHDLRFKYSMMSLIPCRLIHPPPRLRWVDAAIASGESLDEGCFAELNIEEASHNSADC